MTHTFELVRRATRLRVVAASCALLAILVGACNSDDKLAPEGTLAANLDGAVTDSLAPSDPLASTDSLTVTVDSLAVADDSLAVDEASDPAVTMEVSGIEASLASRRGTPYGTFGLWSGYTTLNRNHEPFNASINSDSPSGIIKRISAARAKGHQLSLIMTGGSHGNYISNRRFDFNKWKRRMDAFRTPAIKSAVAAGVRDGTVLMSNMLDEPNHPDWGGVITKATLDKMASYVKSIFPTLPAGVSIRWDWRPNERYHKVDFIQTQYVTRFGSVTSWRNQALAAAKKNGISLSFAINPINGGTRVKNCPLGKTGGKGTYGGNCKMTPSQIRESSLALAPSGCALFMWRYDASYMSRSANVQAFKDVRA
ncbi:MAG TPA: hypothetical protein VIG04_03885, partial [Gemmatimonadales bacterium]